MPGAERPPTLTVVAPNARSGAVTRLRALGSAAEHHLHAERQMCAGAMAALRGRPKPTPDQRVP